jgi:subtilisin family serine protease
MKRNFLSILFVVLMLVPTGAQAKKAPAAPADSTGGATVQQQQDFTERYWQAVESGTLKQFTDDVNGQSDNIKANQEAQMLNNLNKGKSANGGTPVGFHGDSSDSGPSNWSDWNVKTDKDGNVIGFEEKDLDKKDTDGDGKVSKEEREAYDKKKAKEDADAGGPPGNNWVNPDWDKDGDGKPDPGFELDCYRCKKAPTTEIIDEDRCHGNDVGPCPGTCSEGQKCEEYTETGTNQSYICHSCEDKDFCESRGFWSDAACSNECPSGWDCVSGAIDKKEGKPVPDGQTRERGSTEQCYLCHIRIEIEYIIIIIETPYERFVLDKAAPAGGFKPASVMALAKVDKASGMVKNINGQLKPISDFMGAFGIGFGPGGITSPGKMGMDQLSSALGAGLKTGGSYGSDCFGNTLNEADADAAKKGLPTSEEIKDPNKSKKKDTKKEDVGAQPQEQVKKSEDAGSPAVSGPIVACGNEGKNKVLKVYDSAGNLVDTITQAMFKADPGIITKKLGFAQNIADSLIAKSGFDFAKYVEKFTGLPLRKMQEVAAQVQEVKSRMDMAVNKGRGKKRGQEPEIILPNDPLYKLPDAEKKKIESKKPVNIVLGTTLTMGGKALGGGNREDLKEKEEPKAPDQYAMQVIGYTPYTDPNSAWNVVDATQKNMVVAVVDSGLDLSHPDGPQYIWTNPQEIPGNGIDDDKDGLVDDIHGWNFLNENHDFTDVEGHGTFVAGIIAAKTNNGQGIAGINPGAVIMPVKVADDEGQTDSFAVFRGINFAVDHGAKIINVSLGGRIISKLEQQAVDRAYAMGAIVVLAAGNNNENMMTFGPSSSKHGLAVGEIDYDGQRSTASNWGPNLGLVAPGEDIYSLCSKDNKHVLPSIRKNGYYTQKGTSFTSPMVAATASLIWAKNPQLTNQQVVDLILGTAKDMGEQGWDGMTGAGILNAAAALRAQVDSQLVIMFTNMHFNRDVRGNIVSVDLDGSVRGNLREFTIEVGKGKHPGKFTQVAGPFKDQFNYQHITRLIAQDVLRGSDDWVFRIRAIDQTGGEHIASMPVTLTK